MSDTYLVTGSTGVVGSAFVERVLRETQASVQLVIRTKKDVPPSQRLDELMRFWALGPLEADARKRVSVLPGDTEAPRLGLSADDWARASRSVTHIVHAAAIVKMTLPIEAARRAAVSSVENIIELATEAMGHGLQKIELVSTVGVNGRRHEPLPEDWLETQRTFHNTYEEAKADAERISHAAVQRGLPITVIRPSMVVGDTLSGKAIAPQIFSYLCEFLTGVKVQGLFPPLSRARLDVVPVDWVSKLLLHSSQQRAWVGKVLHACSAGASVPLDDLRERVQRIAAEQGRTVQYRGTLPAGPLSRRQPRQSPLRRGQGAPGVEAARHSLGLPRRRSVLRESAYPRFDGDGRPAFAAPQRVPRHGAPGDVSGSRPIRNWRFLPRFEGSPPTRSTLFETEREKGRGCSVCTHGPHW